ncbi:(Fe-S)-binding protein [Porphyromonadaceae bacterium OttesenSCG-928-L07]|nr:(Fe-S)-binding protein [Porphyromonadaceae bacterium OttesenSCG-928-L07]MDL2251242.1 (Fe-S)-binding protein [Odoribacter sp. OttesenSCG-928-J03]
MYYDNFVLPFVIGLYSLLIYLAIKYIRWIRTFPKADKLRIIKGLFTTKTLRSIREIITESIVHNKIFRTNPFLGYMHMCFGLGWFLLIVVGKIESTVYHTSLFNPPYFAIFFRFFHPANETFPGSNTFAFLMDFILLFILSGVFLAWMKRLYSRVVGLKKTTKHRPFDLLILTVLWMIFPLRLLAESFTSGARGGGSFLTHTLGDFFNNFLPLENLIYPAWWAYSSALGLFFILLPGSRYMHIPTEMVFIFLKNWGVKQGRKANAFTEFQLYSCSRCGICIDRCQLNTSLGINDTQSVYFLKKLRHKKDYTTLPENCLMCGRCESSCPVGIELNAIRLSKRPDMSRINKDTYSYIQPIDIKTAKVAYFAGCMGHLTPTVIAAMKHIFGKAGVDYTFLDESKGICCGRPMMLSGNQAITSVIVEKNRQMIYASGAEILVTTCPICYKIFKEEYKLKIKVMHHSEYIDELMKKNMLTTARSNYKTILHNPCELGRGSKVFEAPDNVLKTVSQKLSTKYDGKNSLCCGGSLANTHISAEQRTKIGSDALDLYATYNPDIIATACPLCKKTFTKKASDIQIKDIAELVAENCR